MSGTGPNSRVSDIRPTEPRGQPPVRPYPAPFLGGLPRVKLARLPTPVRFLPASSRAAGGAIWVKDDARTSGLYGGNKVRKLEWVLAQALVTGATKTWTMGPAGSHHVLAVARFSRLLGLQPHAFLFPEFETEHSRMVHQAILESGCRLQEAKCWPKAPVALLRSLPGPGTYRIPAGASNALGNVGFFLAGLELTEQIRTGQCPKPDLVVVALGSAGTAAGLWMGLEAAGLDCRVHAVRVTSGLVANAVNLSRQADELVRFLKLLQAPAGRHAHPPPGRKTKARVITDQFGGTYGKPTERGNEAMALASRDGLFLEPVYTGKAFAHALRAVTQPGCTVLFWNTAAAEA